MRVRNNLSHSYSMINVQKIKEKNQGSDNHFSQYCTTIFIPEHEFENVYLQNCAIIL